MRLFGEKRRSKRSPEICLVRYKRPDSGRIGEGQLANVRDISSGGISMRASEPLHVSTSINILINLPISDGPILAEGEVRQCKKVYGTQVYLVGVQFVKISDAHREQLEQYLSQIRSR